MNHKKGISVKINTKELVLKISLPALAVVIWELLAIYINNPVILPRVEAVINVLIHPFQGILGTGSLIDNTIISIKRVISGFISFSCSNTLRNIDGLL